MSKQHKILGLNDNASEAEIKKAYRKLAMQFHPDTSKSDAYKFHEIKDAYEYLLDNKNSTTPSNPETREDNKVFVRKYNKWVSREEYEDILKNMETYRKKKEEFEENRADIEFEELKKSKVYRTFKYVAIAAILLILLLLIDKFYSTNSSIVTVTKTETTHYSYSQGSMYMTTVYFNTKNNSTSKMTYYGANKFFLKKGLEIELNKSPVFGLITDFRSKSYIFNNKNQNRTFHFPIIVTFSLLLLFSFILKGATAQYYLVLNTSVFGIPVVIFLFLLYVIMH